MDKDLSSARKELKNIRQQMETLKHTYRKDVQAIQKLLQDKNLQTSSDKQRIAMAAMYEEDTSGEESSARAQQVQPIGYIESVFKYKNGTPRQPGVCQTAKATLTILKSVFNNPEHSLEGLEQFSHIWVLFLFHKNNNAYTKAKVKPPRLNGKKVGLFSTRCPYRPNPIGLTLAKVERIQGACIDLSGVDILDGTPVLDIKPYIPQYDQPAISLPRLGLSNSVKHTEMSPLKQEACYDLSCDTSIQGTELLREREAGEVNSCGHQAVIVKETEDMFVEGDMSEETEDMFVNGGMSTDNRWSDVSAGNKHFLQQPSVVCPENNQADFKMNPQPNDAEDNSVHIALTVEKGVKVQIEAEENMLVHKIKDEMNISESVPCENIEDDHLCSSRTATSEQNKSNQGVTFANWIASPPVQKLKVRVTSTAEKQLQKFSQNSKEKGFKLKFLKSPVEAMESIESILEADPRSTYRRTQCVDSLYYFTVDTVHVTCWFDDDAHCVEVVRVKPIDCVPQLVAEPSLKH